MTLPLTTTHTIAWTPTSDRTNAALRVDFSTAAAASGAIYIDTLKLYDMRPTLPDRRGFRKSKILKVPAALTEAGAARIGDTFLRGHRFTPFKGDLAVIGQGGVRQALGGAPVHPAHLLLYYGQLLRFTDRVDPDTGAWGRAARIVAVTYRGADQSALVAVDNQSGHFEALLSRLAVVNAQVR